MPSPPNPSRGLSPGARLAPRAAHLAPRRPRLRAAASDSAGSGASRIQSSWASPWWALAGTRRVWRMQVAGGWALRGPSARAAVSAATAAGDRAPWFCVAGAPGSSRRRSLQRRGQPARPRAERPGGGARVGQSGPPLFRVEGFPPAKRLTHCYSTPASLGTPSPGPVRRDSVRGRTRFCLGLSVGESQGEEARCDFRGGLENFSQRVFDIPRGSNRIHQDPGLVLHLA